MKPSKYKLLQYIKKKKIERIKVISNIQNTEILRNLKGMLSRGKITQDYYNKKIKEL